MATLTVNATLGNDAVSNAQLENMAEGTLKGRAAGGGTGDPQDLTPDQASTILDAATDPFVRTSDLPSGGGDVVGPASSTNNNVPQWDGNTGDLLKDGLAVSQGANGAADSQKLAQYTSTGKLQAGVDNGDGIQGISTNDDGVHGTSQFGSALYGNVTGAGAKVLRLTHAGGSGEFIRCWNGGADQQFVVDFNGAISWPNGGVGPTNTRNNLLPDKTGNAGKLLAVNGGETDYELVAPGITDGSALSIGLQFPNAGLTIADQNADHTLVIVPDENLTADRQLSIRLGDDNRELALTGGSLRVTAEAVLSGTNTGDQTITLTGDVTGSGTGSFAATIANDAVTYAKMQNVSATDRILGRQSSGAGDVEEITCTAAGRALLDDADANAQRETLGLIRRKITTATTGVSTSYTDVTDMNFSVVAGTTYLINAWVLAECSSTSGGVCLSANGPAFTWYSARYEGTQAGGGNITRPDIVAYDSLGTPADPTSVTAANTPYLFVLQAILVPSADGTFTLRVKRGGTTGTVAVRAGALEATAM